MGSKSPEGHRQGPNGNAKETSVAVLALLLTLEQNRPPAVRLLLLTLPNQLPQVDLFKACLTGMTTTRKGTMVTVKRSELT